MICLHGFEHTNCALFGTGVQHTLLLAKPSSQAWFGGTKKNMAATDRLVHQQWICIGEISPEKIDIGLPK
jgi:hypothetical protein